MNDEIKTYVACARAYRLLQRNDRQRYDGLANTFEVSSIRGHESVASVVGRRRETSGFISETEFHLA